MDTTIQVTLIDEATDQIMAQSMMSASQLPETFELETILHLGEDDWEVMKATPSHVKDFSQTKMLELRLKKVEKMNPKDILFSIPTITDELPAITETPLFNDFEIQLLEDDWRQNEFLKLADLPLAEAELEEIKIIWEDESKQAKQGFYSFSKIHVRKSINLPRLDIPFQTLKTLLNTNQVGNIKVDEGLYVKNGFVLQTENATYYGIVENELVQEFCIYEFEEEASKEILNICQNLKLFFVDWCNVNIIQ